MAYPALTCYYQVQGQGHEDRHLPEEAAGVRQYLLTIPNLGKLKELCDDERIARAWTTEGVTT
jgi:hypothetical protein